VSDYLTPAQFADAKHIPLPTVYRWLRLGWLPAERAGKRNLRIRREDAAAFRPPRGVVPHTWGLHPRLCPREAKLWGAVGAAYVGAHGDGSDAYVHPAWNG
jgi:excisionase family DNA binding protein